LFVLAVGADNIYGVVNSSLIISCPAHSTVFSKGGLNGMICLFKKDNVFTDRCSDIYYVEHLENGTIRLEIVNVSQSDAGLYTCTRSSESDRDVFNAVVFSKQRNLIYFVKYFYNILII